MFDPALVQRAHDLLSALRARQMTLATAESCTGGLIAALMTEVPGSSDVVDRGFVTYSNAAKAETLGVPWAMLGQFGAVSREVAIEMAECARSASKASIAVAVTGVAGPGGGSVEKPVGLVHLSVAMAGQPTQHAEERFGDIGRSAVRAATVLKAIGMIEDALRRA